MPGDSLIPDAGAAVFTPPPVKTPPKMRAFGDAAATRTAIYDATLKAARELEPLADDRHTLRLTGVDWADPEKFGRHHRKQAVLTGETLARRLAGTWELLDNATGNVVDSRKQVVARVPYLSSLGTFTHRGSEYGVINQQRLDPGVFTRVKANGQIEAHANVKTGTGPSHRYFLDPDKGVFKLHLGQAEMPLMPLLQAMGATNAELREAWGPDLHAANAAKNQAGVLKKMADRVLRKAEREGDEGSLSPKLVAAFERMALDPEVSRRTLGHPHEKMDKAAILATTKKLLAVSRGEAEPDDRDALTYQTVYGPEDLFAERIRRDHGRLRAGLFRKLSANGSLAKMPAGALTPQIEQVLLGSGLGQHLEEINPLEVLDKQSRLTRMGEGGIPSLDAIPEEARSVQPSHLNFIDPIRTPESFRAGVDVNLARGTMKGADGQIYAPFRNPQTGAIEHKTPREVADSVLTFPHVLSGRDYQGHKRVPVMIGGQYQYRKKGEVQYAVPDAEGMFSHLGNLIPMKSMLKGQRMAMGSRMLTQALPLVNAEAPLVQGALPGSGGSRSYEEEYAHHAGAVSAKSAGHVVSAGPDGIKVQYDDGKTDDVELYNNFPFNRKTFVHQTPLVKPGDTVTAGQPLAKSNYTDHKGAIALGMNARTAYLPWHGYNFEDAVAISESMAKRLSSEHAYQHELEVTDRHKLGRNAFVSLFPAAFDHKTLSKLDDKGVIQPGQTVEFGDPLILAAKERDRAFNKVHKKGQPGYQDESVVWKHHDPGVVTDVAWGKAGPTVLVKSVSPSQVGDKLSGRYGDKGVISKIIPDAQMPHDKDGQPFEALLNPLGLISRTNASQMAEAWLGKIARKTGKPVKVEDFADQEDMLDWVRQQLAQHNLPDTEDVVDPTTGRRIGGVATGERFLMKLHHVAESKAQGRGSGGYTSEDAPSKGGDTGCFLGTTLVRVPGPVAHGAVTIRSLVTGRQTGKVYSAKRDNGFSLCTQPVSDWFTYRVLPTMLVCLTLPDDELLVVTRGHRMVMADGSFRLAGDLEAGDLLMGVDDGDGLLDFDGPGGRAAGQAGSGRGGADLGTDPEPGAAGAGPGAKPGSSAVVAEDRDGDEDDTALAPDDEAGPVVPGVPAAKSGVSPRPVGRQPLAASVRQVPVAAVAPYRGRVERDGLVTVYDLTVVDTHLYVIGTAGVVVSNSKRISMLDTNALLSAGAVETLRDVGAVRGQKNEQYWLQVMNGHAPLPPKVPRVYEKFVAHLKGAGINVATKGSQLHVMALTNADVDQLAGPHEVTVPETVHFDKDMRPIRGGLFDERLTGGHGGNQWAAIKLPEPMPSPAFEEPIRRLLGLTQKKFEAVLSGEHTLPGAGTGPGAIGKALDRLDIDRELAKVKAQWASTTATARDEAKRKWGYLADAKRLNLHPRDWMLSRAPVLPPVFRPVAVMGSGAVPLVSDPNYLYAELLHATKNHEQMKAEVGEAGLGPERLAVYHAFKAVTGLGAPVHPKLIEKNVKGLLKTVFGSSPKFGMMQRKLLSHTVDNVGRAVITPEPAYDMDTVGLPEDQAFSVYSKFIVRDLKRRGLPVREALKHVTDRTPLARDVLLKEMDRRPVWINRAPVLHKFGIMAFRPQLVRGNVMKVSPLIVKGFGADFDGDTMQFHVPATDEAVKEAYARGLPSKNLLAPNDFKSPVHAPGQEYLAGIFFGTGGHGPSNKRPRYFRNRQDVTAAWKRGEIGANDPVNVLES